MTQYSEDLVRSLVHKTNQDIKTSRDFLNDMEKIARQFGWKWGHICEGDEVDQMRAKK